MAAAAAREMNHRTASHARAAVSRETSDSWARAQEASRKAQQRDYYARVLQTAVRRRQRGFRRQRVFRGPQFPSVRPPPGGLAPALAGGGAGGAGGAGGEGEGALLCPNLGELVLDLLANDKLERARERAAESLRLWWAFLRRRWRRREARKALLWRESMGMGLRRKHCARMVARWWARHKADVAAKRERLDEARREATRRARRATSATSIQLMLRAKM